MSPGQQADSTVQRLPEGLAALKLSLGVETKRVTGALTRWGEVGKTGASGIAWGGGGRRSASLAFFFLRQIKGRALDIPPRSLQSLPGLERSKKVACKGSSWRKSFR